MKRPSSPRATAVEVLCLWATTHNSIDLLLQAALAKVADIDRPLMKSLVYGVLRQKEYLDHILRQFAKHPLRSMKPRTLMTLRIGVFQLLFCSRIPESAAVNATVNTLKEAGQPQWLIGFANGILRAVARGRAALPTPEALAAGEPPILNHPAWLIERWQTHFGRETTRTICQLNNTEPLLSLRVNTRRTSRSALINLFSKAGIAAEPGYFSPLSLIIAAYPGGIASLPGYAEGYFQVQDEAPQLASMLAGSLPARARVLDGCAGVGGKTTHLAEMLPPGGQLIAVEPDTRRYGLLRENLQRLGLTVQVRCVRTDLSSFAQANPQPFDCILVDAPCSGTGVIRRQPDIRWNRKPEELQQYQQKQLQLLDLAASMLKPGGTLIYATCSLEPEENEEVITRFRATHQDFVIQDGAPLLPETAKRLIGQQGYFHPTPADGLDGFFAACLKQARGL